MPESEEDELKHFAELLIEKGFAKRHLLDTKRGFGEFIWTRRGKILRRHLCELFDVPAVSPSDLDGHEIMGVISLILFSEPTD